MREQYERQVELLIDVLPFVAKSKVFALKGGTAINFFYLDCPRLSVDIDLHYLPLNTRDEALADIAANMQTIAANIKQVYPDTTVRIDNSTLKAVVSRKGNLIKIEPNKVIRGGLLPAIKKPLSPHLEQQYGRAISVSCLAKEELYAGKLCAALQRQHPRDLFDIWHFFQQHDLTPKIMDVFVVYLISQGKPIYEGLNPNREEISELYHSHFAGMAKNVVALEQLLEIQNILPQYIVASLTTKHREFILGFKQGNPDWSLLPFATTQHLPAVRWKQLNLDRMDSAKRQLALNKLQDLFESIPYNPQQVQLQMAKKQPMVLHPQEQLAAKIAETLVTSGLLEKSKQQQISQKIAAGQLKREDWSLLVELALKPNIEEGKNDA